MKCHFCGYQIKRPDGYITSVLINGKRKRAHIGCAEQHYNARKKTQELLDQVKEIKK